jgi:hypothetical protein
MHDKPTFGRNGFAVKSDLEVGKILQSAVSYLTVSPAGFLYSPVRGTPSIPTSISAVRV